VFAELYDTPWGRTAMAVEELAELAELDEWPPDAVRAFIDARRKLQEASWAYDRAHPQTWQVERLGEDGKYHRILGNDSPPTA
jgi:hypothetical protein